MFRSEPLLPTRIWSNAAASPTRLTSYVLPCSYTTSSEPTTFITLKGFTLSFFSLFSVAYNDAVSMSIAAVNIKKNFLIRLSPIYLSCTFYICIGKH